MCSGGDPCEGVAVGFTVGGDSAGARAVVMMPCSAAGSGEAGAAVRTTAAATAAATRANPDIIPVRSRERAEAGAGAPPVTVSSLTGGCACRRLGWPKELSPTRGYLFRRNRRLPPANIQIPIRPVAAAAAPRTVPAFADLVSAAVSIFTPRPAPVSVPVPAPASVAVSVPAPAGVPVSAPVPAPAPAPVPAPAGVPVSVPVPVPVPAPMPVPVLKSGAAPAPVPESGPAFPVGDSDEVGSVEGVGDAVTAGDDDAEAVGVVEAEGDAVAQPGMVKTFVSSDTCPFRASALPWTVVPVVAVIEVRARMLPLNVDAVPRVAELPTCQ